MNPIAILEEVEADVKSLGSISTEIRAKLKAGVANLTAIRDEMTSLVEAVMGKANGALASLKTVADEVSKDAEDSKGKSDTGSGEPAAPVTAQTPTGAMTTVDTKEGITTHEGGDGTVTTVPHDGTAPTAVAASGQPVEPSPEAVAEAHAAAKDAGVTVAQPEAAPVF